MVFEPAVLKINKGDTVNFVATDAAHNSASLPGMIPVGAGTWTSELSQDISVTFDVEGLYAYQCTPHAVMAMVGVIQVGENPANLRSGLASQAENMKSMFVMNQDRLNGLHFTALEFSRRLVDPNGLEPSTSAMSMRRSNQN